MQQQGERNTFKVLLADGRNVDICTESGANAFLEAGSKSRDFLKGNVERMAEICAKRKLNARDKGDLIGLNLFFESISQYASHDVFRQHVELSTVKTWLDFVIGQIKRYTVNRNWITTGQLPTHDSKLLESCISMMSHAVPTALAFEGEFFTALADFVKARKGTGRALPSDDICDTITLIVANAHHSSRMAFDNTWTTEKSLKKLEATGILEQFLRCVTVPQAHDFSAPGLFKFLDQFQACMPFISKRLQAGEPCGDVVIAILEGKDGSRVKRPSVLNRLQTMIRFASSIDPELTHDDGIKMCRKCGKSDHSEAFQKSLMKCSRCQSAWYCSKECQKADWKTHKLMCAPTTKKDRVMAANVQQTLMNFCHRHYVDIMVKFVESCKETGLSKKDMLVELNFAANANGVVPAMQSKPDFKVAPIKDYVEGSRPAEPDWFYKNIDRTCYEHNVKGYLAAIKEKQSKLLPKQILCLMKYEGGFSCFSVCSVDPTKEMEMFSDEAFLAFKAKIDNNDDGPLSTMFGPQKLQEMKRELFRFGYGTPDLQTIRDAMDVLRMYEERNGGL